MLQAVLDVAKSVGYKQAELEVNAENINAIAMYEKLGLQQDGCCANINNMEKWINIDEAAEFLGVKPGTIRGWM